MRRAGGGDAGNDATGAGLASGLGSGLAFGTTGSIFGRITDPGRGGAGAAGSGVQPGRCGRSRDRGGGVTAATAPDLPRRSNEKSETSEFDTHGTCCPWVPRDTLIRVRLKTSSAGKSGTRSCLTNSVRNRRCSEPVSLDDGARRRGIHHQRPGRRVDRGKSGREPANAPLVGIAPRRIDNGNLDLGAARIHFPEDGFQADAVTRHVGFAPDLPVDRNDVALPGGLNGVAAEKHQRHRAGRDLGVEAIEFALHSISGKILGEGDLKSDALSLELVGQRPRILDRVFQRLLQGSFGIRVVGIADDESQPRSRTGLLGQGVALS